MTMQEPSPGEGEPAPEFGEGAPAFEDAERDWPSFAHGPAGGYTADEEAPVEEE